ncbi:MAG: 2,3-bisphosphoglycerate-independent phosphoglycerate mutase [Acidobacteriota bacterium]
MSRQSSSGERGRRRALTVVTSRGNRQRFLRGMVTHDLMQRGLDFDSAYASARAIRDHFGDRDEVTTAEIRDLVDLHLEGLAGEAVLPARPAPDLFVVYHGEKQPFSRGLLARSVLAAGVDLDRAYRLVVELRGELRAEGVEVLPSAEIARRMGALLERFEGPDAARRYRLVRRISRLPRPLVIYLGGASGTGKSTLALELAPLLRIYRVTATDTIRQVMRMVFSSAILPALHTSSFETADGVAATDGLEGGERLLASFEEQATRVAVGVRAVVERAIAENLSVLVEGVHLYPPLIPFGDLEGAVYQVPLILGTLDAEAHRPRFLSRARLGGRRAERYVESFGAIRAIHDHVLQQAELHDVPLLDTSRGELPVAESLRLITGLLERRLPALAQEEVEPESVKGPTLLLIIDGMADRPVRSLGGRTPLQAAETPTLDRLAREGRCGLADPISPGVVPDTAAGSLALFGQSPLALKRGPVEALGAGVELSAGDVALRGNFATLDADGRVIDRRAGRIRLDTEELAAVLDRLPLPGSLADEAEVRVKAATEHRLAVVLRGEGLSSAIGGSDPGDGALGQRPLTPQSTDPDDPRAVYTARILALFEEEARRLLADHPVNRRRHGAGQPMANAVLTRGAGRPHRLIPLESGGDPLRLACISGDRTVLGLARWLGAEIVSTPAMTANLDTDLATKLNFAADHLRRGDLVVVHVKGADIAAHDRRPDLKVEFLERVDGALGELLESTSGPLRVAVASDHATLSESGQHAADPLPVLIWGEGIEADAVQVYDEHAAVGGSLQRFPLQMLLGRLFDLV